MRTELVSEPGDRARPNEDFAAVALPASGQGGVAVLLDGVTPPAGETGCLHSVPWFTARLGGALTELAVSCPDVPLASILALAITRTSEAHSHSCDLSHPRTPQATVVVVRWSEGGSPGSSQGGSKAAVEYLVLSDSVLLVESGGGVVTAVLDDRLSRLPRASLATDAIVDSTVRNKEGGFFTAAADPAVAGRAVTGVFDRGAVRAVVALTDGASRWVEKFREGGWGDCFTFVRKEGAGALVERVRELEAGDAEGRVFLGRSKTHDDASVVFVEL
ncbi:hypothetical protein [Streptomyces sp. NPDC046909]|uniref:hypothetical protein n=1 Tax=Streptomyces sp. NPDC046909 TaxID=3155617 RepID=UPI0034082D72